MLSRVCSLLRIGKPSQEDNGLLLDSGDTVPTAGTAGFRTGCLFQHTDGGDGTSLYVNEGSVTSCSFKAVTVAD